MGSIQTDASRLSDVDLLRRVVSLAAREREGTVDLVGHLAELDVRKLHLARGYGSLFAYCTERLHLSEYGAYNRMEAARARMFRKNFKGTACMVFMLPVVGDRLRNWLGRFLRARNRRLGNSPNVSRPGATGPLLNPLKIDE